MMMNEDDASYCGGELPYVVAPGNPVQLPPTPSLFLPVMDQLASSSFLRSEQLGSSDNIEVNVPTLLAPGSSAATDYTSSRYGHDRDILQFYPSASHYLAAGNPYSHFSQSNFLPSSSQEYYFPTLLDENMASFPYAQLGLNSLNYSGYQPYYFPPRGGYAYGHHPPRCQVDGCTADLSKAKRYHRRHRVCEHHSKAPVVITARAIMPQRFCQQCSRFHEVDEFDDTKKSCRQRLADHNRRRRKPKPSGTDVQLKKRAAHAKRSASSKDNKGNSSTNMGTGDVLLGGTQELGSASKEHDHHRSMGLGEVVAVTEPVDPKGKAPMTKQHEHQQGRAPQPKNVQQGFPLNPSSGNSTGLPQSQRASGGSTSNIARVQEPPGLLAFQQHYPQCNILQLGHAVFDLDFDH